MSENGESVNSSSIDNALNRSVKAKEPLKEKFQAVGKGGLPIADQHVPLSDTEPTRLTSWTMREIERAIAGDTLKPSRTKIEQFASSQSKRSDFRMRGLAHQLGLNIKRDHQKEMISGVDDNRVRNFDVQSQTMRTITANAAMGSWQFQKNMTLPYMRKNLALGYQKVAILKEISGGITSLEKSVVSKLEAIKINTAATAPRKEGFFKKLMNDVGFLSMRRISTNISNFMMDRWDDRYKKHITPRLNRFRNLMNDQSSAGGINAVRRSVTGRLNSLRRSAREASSRDYAQTDRFGSIKKSGAQFTERALGRALRFTQKARLSNEKNRAFSRFLGKPAATIAKFNPFAFSGRGEVEYDDDAAYSGKTASIIDIVRPIGATRAFGDLLSPLAPKGIGDSSVDISQKAPKQVAPFTSHIDMYKLHMSTKKHREQAGFDRAFIGKMFDNLGKKVENVSSTVKEGNTARSKFETIQTKWKEAADKLFKKPRKNSYEDIMAKREQEKDRKGLLGRIFGKAGAVAAGVMGNLAQGNIAGAGFDAAGQAVDWATGAAGEFVSERAGKAGSKLWRKAKILSSSRGRRLARAMGRRRAAAALAGGAVTSAPGLIKGTLGRLIGRKAAPAIAGQVVSQTAKRGLASKAGSALFKGSKYLAGTGLSLAAAGGKKLLGASVKGAGSLSGKALASLGRGGVKLLKTAGPGIVIGLAGDLADNWFEKNTTGTTKRLGTTAARMASWGATGATIGSIVPGIGTGIGAAVGAGGGAISANMDYVRKGLGYLVNKTFNDVEMIGSIGKFAWKSILGSEPKIDKWGRVKEKETQPLIGKINTLFFGRDAKYSKSGDIIIDGKKGIVSDVRKGFDLFFFGIKDPKEKNKFKPNSSIMSKMASGFSESLDTFKSFMKELPSKISDIFKGLGAGASGLLESAGNTISRGYDYVKKGVDSAGAVVSGNLTDLMKRAKGMVGLNENTDRGKIQEYLGKGGALTNKINPASTPWCAAFVNATLAQAGIKGSGSLAASSFKTWGIKVDPAQVREGDVLIEDRGSAPGAAGDHVGLATGATRVNNGRLQIEMLSGNSRNSVTRVFYDASKLKIRRGEPSSGQSSGGQSLLPSSPTGGINNPWSKTFSGGSVSGPGTGSVLMGNKPNSLLTAPVVNGKLSDSPTGYGLGNGPIDIPQAGKSAKDLFNYAVNYLSGSKGYSRVAAMGISANLYGESNLKTNAFNSRGGGKGAKGIAQWRGTRITEIEQRFGKPIERMSLKEQLDAVDMELKEGKHVTKSSAIRDGTSPIVSTINNSPNVEAVVQQMVHRYERPGTSVQALEAETRKRIQIAYSLMGGMGTNVPSTEQKKTDVAAKSPMAVKPKPAAPTQTSKPKTPTPAPAPKKEESSFLATAESTLSKIGDYFTGGDKPKSTDDSKNVVFAPVITNNKKSGHSAATTTMSMAKTSVRTGN